MGLSPSAYFDLYGSRQLLIPHFCPEEKLNKIYWNQKIFKQPEVGLRVWELDGDKEEGIENFGVGQLAQIVLEGLLTFRSHMKALKVTLEQNSVAF